MKYKIVKKIVGKKSASIFSTFETEKEIIDTAFDENIGIMFIERDNPSISLVDLKGELIENWIGKKGDCRYQNGSQQIARFASPCSICLSKTKAYVLEEDGFVIRTFGLKSKYVENFSGNKYKADLKKYVSSKKKPSIFKSAAVQNKMFFTNDISNKLFCVSGGNLSYVVGDGKARYSVSSEYTRSSFNRPSGIFCVGGVVYISDTRNHCIRQVDKKKKSVNIVSGSPVELDDSDYLLKSPSKLVIRKNMVFILDDNSIKVTSLGSNNISVIYESDTIDSLEADGHRNVYIVERENG